MDPSKDTQQESRRRFMQQSGALAIGVPLLGSLPSVHVGENNTIRLALIGCGSRGGGAVRDAFSARNGGPIKLHAMADLLEDRLSKSYNMLKDMFSSQVDVADDRKFLGFDAYQKAIDALRPGDIALCTTRCYIRPLHVEYAVKKGIHVFMEKPFAPDPAGLRRMLRAGELAEQNNVKIAAGLQCRHSPARHALIHKIRDGALGDIQMIRANRLGGVNSLVDQRERATDLINQLKFGKIHLFWVGSGHMVDYLIHQIDECCWIKDSWPISAQGLAGRVPKSVDCGQNLDAYSMEYTFADGTKAFCGFRRMKDARGEFATFLHGTKCAAQFSGRTHAATVHMFKDQRIRPDKISWTPSKDVRSPWQYEWDDFIESIRNDRPHNEARRAVYSDMAALMGRAACHTGQTVTWDDVANSKFQFCDSIDHLDFDSPVPIRPDENGQFEVPIPGQWTEV